MIKQRKGSRFWFCRQNYYGFHLRAFGRSRRAAQSRMCRYMEAL